MSTLYSFETQMFWHCNIIILDDHTIIINKDGYERYCKKNSGC